MDLRRKIGRFELEAPLALAPMCGVTDLAMRRVARSHGAALCFTQMVSAEGLLRGSERTEELLCNGEGDAPLGVQIFGGRPEALAEAARRICDEHGVSWIDLNMGCPVRKVACHEAGSGLLKDIPLVEKIFQALRKALPGENFTVKVRAGWDEKSLVVDDLARLADDCGVDAITLHPRTRAQGYSGAADWTRIARLKEKTRRTAVFGSGDLFEPADVLRMLAETGADGCFLARGATGNPWIFSRSLALLRGQEDPGLPTPRELFETVCDHLKGMVELYGEVRAVKMFRAHLSGYVKGLRNAAALRREIFTLPSAAAVEGVLAKFLLEEAHPPALDAAGPCPPAQVA